MTLPNGNFIGNRAGVLFVNATQTSAGSASTDAVYTLPNHTFRYLSGLGIFVCDFDTAVTTATGITISVNSCDIPLTSSSDEVLTELPAGLHILVFNKFGNKLLLTV